VSSDARAADAEGAEARRYVVLALGDLVYSVHLAFPTRGSRTRGSRRLKSRYEVTVGKVERGWLPGDFSLVKVKLISRPAKATEARRFVSIDSPRHRRRRAVGPERLGRRRPRRPMGTGHIAGTITVGKDRLRAAVTSRNLSLSRCPGWPG